MYNADKVHVANIYVQMQRQGQVLPQNDFMTDIAERLNLESAKLVKQDSTEAKQERKAKKAEEKALKKKQAEPTSPSAMELTQQLFGVPQLGFSVQEEREKAIPIFDPFLMGENA